MSIRNLKRVFEPQRVAVVGASRSPEKVGWTVLKNLLGGGFGGAIYPINPHPGPIQGLEAYPSLEALPHAADLVLVCVPAARVPAVIRDCGTTGAAGAVVLSAGFREVGAEGRALEEAILRTAREFDGLRILGPNCLGFMAPAQGLNASFAAAMPPPGSVAFVSQSGALCTAVLDWSLREGVGFSHFMSIGNMLEVGFGDLIDFLATDRQTQALILYVESITEPREFMSAARAFARTKPIVAYKAGRFAQSAKAAMSHTGALAGVDAVYEAAFQRAGIVRVHEISDMFGCAELLSRKPSLVGRRLAIVTNAGGPGVIATDALVELQGTLAELAPETLRALDAALPPAWSRNNPVDILGDAHAARYGHALRLVLADRGVDAALVLLTPQAMTQPEAAARAVAETSRGSSKPVLASWMGAAAVDAGLAILNRAGIATYPTPEQAVRAFMYLVSYARNREILYDTPRELPVRFALAPGQLRAQCLPLLGEAASTLSEEASKTLLDTFGIEVSRPLPAASAEEAVSRSREVGFPVVLKIRSPEISHKTEVGGVVLNLASADEVRAAFAAMTSRARTLRPEARVEGVTVQPMVSSPAGVELILGARKDAVFGPVIMVGLGGTSAELLGDLAWGLPPLSERLARRMLESLRSWPLLNGYRGRPAADVDRLLELLIRFSYLVAEFPEIQEIDCNPLLVSAELAIVLDARIVVDRDAVGRPVRRFAHLAIHPYPDEFEAQAVLNDGTPVWLRPLKPEDEPLWFELLEICSQESLRFRFHSLFKQATHAMAARFCYVDYDRELPIVAEIDHDGRRRLVAVSRLVADPDHRTAEFAILVADAWQGRGLGGRLLDHSLAIARQWGLRAVYGETETANRRMIETFRSRGFHLAPGDDATLVLATRQLDGAQR